MPRLTAPARGTACSGEAATTTIPSLSWAGSSPPLSGAARVSTEPGHCWPALHCVTGPSRPALLLKTTVTSCPWRSNVKVVGSLNRTGTAWLPGGAPTRSSSPSSEASVRTSPRRTGPESCRPCPQRRLPQPLAAQHSPASASHRAPWPGDGGRAKIGGAQNMPGRKVAGGNQHCGGGRAGRGQLLNSKGGGSTQQESCHKSSSAHHQPEQLPPCRRRRRPTRPVAGTPRRDRGRRAGLRGHALLSCTHARRTGARAKEVAWPIVDSPGRSCACGGTKGRKECLGQAANWWSLGGTNSGGLGGRCTAGRTAAGRTAAGGAACCRWGRVRAGACRGSDRAGGGA